MSTFESIRVGPVAERRSSAREWVAVLVLGISAPAAVTADEISARVQSRVSFEEAVAAIFRARCVSCHGEKRASGDLRLDGYDEVMRGGEQGPVVVPGNPGASLLMQKVLRLHEPAMPPRFALPSAEQRQIRRWIRRGAGP